jgi:class 3 adenylate cyclase
MPDNPANTGTQFLERKLATILSADVAEFSRLMGEDEEQTLRTFRGHKKVFESLVTMHRGRIFNTAGDAILAEFASAVEAVRCATDIQSALRTRNDQLPLSRQVRFRIGINLGDVMVQGQDLLGDGVNVAARLQTAAQPGGICLSGSVYDQIRNKLSLSFQSLGEKSYKNIQQPVRTFSILEADGTGADASANPTGTRIAPIKWVAAGFLIAIVVGGSYWAYTARERNKAESARAIAPASAVSPAQTAEVPSERTKTEVQTPSVQPAVVAAPTPNATPAGTTNKTETATKPASAPHPASAAVAKTAAASHAAAPHESPATRSVVGPPTTAVPVSRAAYDGFYAGPICYGPTRVEPARCYRATGTIAGNKITSRWVMGHDAKVALILAGEVNSSGDAKIEMEMHQGSFDGERVATIDFAGTIRNGQLNMNGTFRKGRTATLNWHKISDKQP